MPIPLIVSIIPDAVPSAANVLDESKSKPGSHCTLKKTCEVSGMEEEYWRKQKNKEEGGKPKQKCTPWEERFNELNEYKEKNDNCTVSRSLGALGTWVGKQRTVYRKEKLLQVRTSKLEGIGFN